MQDRGFYYNSFRAFWTRRFAIVVTVNAILLYLFTSIFLPTKQKCSLHENHSTVEAIAHKTLSIPELTDTACTPEGLPHNMQQSVEQVCGILAVLPKDGNLLVWGLGNDSNFWSQQTRGRVVFLEDDFSTKKAGTQWFDAITRKFPHLEAYKVHYTTDVVQSFDKYMTMDLGSLDADLNVLKQLPVEVQDIRWDVILVDAPLGCCDTGPGRYQSIYTSKVMSEKKAKKGHITYIFVDDYDRKVERLFSKKVFQVEPLRVIARRPSNEQALFMIK